jgi:hypothetical protein
MFNTPIENQIFKLSDALAPFASLAIANTRGAIHKTSSAGWPA